MQDAKKSLTLAEILTELNRYCAAGISGTLFITTQDNRSAGFVFQNKQILSCAYGHERGLAALEKLKQMTHGSCAFSDKLIFSIVDETATLPQTPDIFAYLGHSYQEHFADETADASTSNAATEAGKKTYRGVPVAETAPAAKPPNNDNSNKPRRIYRGQILDN